MKKLLLILGLSLALVGCGSNFQEFENSTPKEQIISSGPYSISVSGYNPEAEELIKVYIETTFGQSLSFSDSAKSEFKFTFVSEATTNAYATWRDGTGFIQIKDEKGKLVWAGEYNYKGCMEMSGFSVRTDIEAAKLTIQRIYKEFNR